MTTATTATARASTASTLLLLAIAWGCGIGGVLWSYLLALASASTAVPEMPISRVLMNLPFPLVAVLCAWFVIKRARSGAAAKGFLWAAIPPFLCAAFALYITVSTYANVA